MVVWAGKCNSTVVLEWNALCHWVAWKSNQKMFTLIQNISICDTFMILPHLILWGSFPNTSPRTHSNPSLAFSIYPIPQLSTFGLKRDQRTTLMVLFFFFFCLLTPIEERKTQARRGFFVFVFADESQQCNRVPSPSNMLFCDYQSILHFGTFWIRLQVWNGTFVWRICFVLLRRQAL